ncbi:nuclear transport factor 2 family protein [Pseudonocardia sp.]|uniref:nuclear transport factor 2 family protein n=1 Tax=Pseudonocardia sp. TaxID=60912 RepID=UPI003D0D6363
MTPTQLSVPVVADLIAAINRGDRDAFLATLTPDATLTDDGSPRELVDWVDREVFSSHGRVTVDREEDGGLRLFTRYRNDLWGEMSTFWRFRLTGDRISRIETGQA